jgi:hypothetical protein
VRIKPQRLVSEDDRFLGVAEEGQGVGGDRKHVRVRRALVEGPAELSFRLRQLPLLQQVRSKPDPGLGVGRIERHSAPKIVARKLEGASPVLRVRDRRSLEVA